MNVKNRFIKSILFFFTFVVTSHAAEIYNTDNNKLDLYGKIDARHTISDASSKDGDQSYMHFGLKGETEINQSVTGYGQWEYNLQGNYAESQGDKGNATRVAFAGLKVSDLGSIDYGRNYGLIYDIESYTDMLPAFGGDGYTTCDNYMIKRANGLLTYRNSDFFGLVDGLNVSVQYQGKNGSTSESTNGRSLTGQNGDGVSMSVSYALPAGISLATAYSVSNRTLGQKAAGAVTNSGFAAGDKAESWASGVKYDKNNIYLAALYAETLNTTPFGSGDIANKTSNIELTAQYLFNNGLKPSLGFVQSRGIDLNNAYADDALLVKYIEMGTYYYFNKNMITYVDYKINLLKKNNFTINNNIVSDNVLAVGLIYEF